MAAAEYYNTTAAQTAPQYTQYQQSPYQRPHELQGSPAPQPSVPQQHGPPPPPYQPMVEEHKPSVHFTPPPSPPQSDRHSGHSSNRPSFSSPRPSSHGQHLTAPPHHSPYAQHASTHLVPQMAAQPPHMRPYMNANVSEQSLYSGHLSDPESRRRRRHRRHDHREDAGSARETRPSKNRSRSTNTDGLLGAAGGGLIGDMIFPGLGTVGGVVAGWLGGKDYGKHRKHREDRRHQEQRDWEYRFRERANSDQGRLNHDVGALDGHRNHRSRSRNRNEY